MSKFTKINCPICDQTLIRLGVDVYEDGIVNAYYCDNCDIDITIESEEFEEKDLELENFI